MLSHTNKDVFGFDGYISCFKPLIIFFLRLGFIFGYPYGVNNKESKLSAVIGVTFSTLPSSSFLE